MAPHGALLGIDVLLLLSGYSVVLVLRFLTVFRWCLVFHASNLKAGGLWGLLCTFAVLCVDGVCVSHLITERAAATSALLLYAACSPVSVVRPLLATKRTWKARPHPNDYDIIVETYDAQVRLRQHRCFSYVCLPHESPTNACRHAAAGKCIRAHGASVTSSHTGALYDFAAFHGIVVFYRSSALCVCPCVMLAERFMYTKRSQ